MLINSPAIRSVSETAIEFAPGMKFEEWESIGLELQRVGRCWQWWIGDWLNFGEESYGEKYAQAIEETGIPYGTLQNCAYVASRVEMSRRRDIVCWSSHSEVAKLDPRQQDNWLKKVEKDSLTVSELRAAIKESKKSTDDSETELNSSVVVQDRDDKTKDFEPSEVNPRSTQVNPEPDWKEHRKAAVNYANYLQRAIDDLNDVRGSGQKRRHTDAITKTQEVIKLLEGWT